MLYFIPIIMSYLLGSIIFSFVIGKLIKGIDVRQHGSGNAGATNTLRTLGKGPGILVLVLDLMKGVLAIWLAKWLAPEQLWIAVSCGVLVVIGHNWPVFFKFKGGKGVATTVGVALTLCFWPTVFAIIMLFIVTALTRYMSVGSMVFAATLPFFIWLLYDPFPFEIFTGSIVLAGFVFVRHRKNIMNLIRGQENKLGTKKERVS